ncbi:HAD family hydrolase [Longispora albida]|uniref:HAD family hydrolase n=1 Tax=Longispora albida TaxID=203523 RepID=UPI00036E990A|nr:HAD family phosphatase [Longispora albida]
MCAVRGIIFDLDGLIIDSEGVDQIAWREEFARAGVPVTPQVYAEFWHSWSWERQIRMIHRLEALVGSPVDQEAILASRLARYTELCADLPARPGIREWITEAHRLGLRLGVATNDDTGRAGKHLARLGLDVFLDAVVVLEKGFARKPAPDLYLQALKLLDLEPGEAVAVEDSSHGVEAAHRAGMLAIAYPTPTVSAHTDLSAADLIADAAALTLTDALAKLDAAPLRQGS